MAARSNHIAIKHSQIPSNIKTYEIEGVNNIDHPISPDSKLTLTKLIMDLKTEEGDKNSIENTHSWNGVLELWVKKKHKKIASVVANHLPTWLHKSHGDLILPSFSAECQKLAKETKWEGNTPLNTDDVATQVNVDVEIN